MRERARPSSIVFCVDVDGTLVARGKPPTPAVASALRRIEAVGATVVLATGRQFNGIRQIIDQFRFDGPHIACDGAVVQSRDGSLVFRGALPPHVVEICSHVASSQEITALLAAEGRTFTLRWTSAVEYAMSYGDPAPTIVSDLRAVPFPATHIMFVEPKYPDLLDRVKDRLRDALEGSASVRASSPGYVTVVGRDVSKGRALEIVGRALGVVPSRHVVAIGDGENDLPMMERAALSIAMASAPGSVQHRADRVVPGCEDDGLVEAIELGLDLLKDRLRD